MVEFGKKIFPKKPKNAIEKGATWIKGPYWSIELKDGNFVFEYLSASHGGGVLQAVITKADFDAVLADQMTENQLIQKYDLN